MSTISKSTSIQVLVKHFSPSIHHFVGLIPDGKLQHLISDAATMQIIRWTKGN